MTFDDYGQRVTPGTTLARVVQPGKLNEEYSRDISPLRKLPALISRMWIQSSR